MRKTRIVSFASFAILAACGGSPSTPATPATPVAPVASSATPASTASTSSTASKAHDAVDRATFNKAAARLNLPLYWTADPDKNGAIEPSETASLLFYPTSSTAKWTDGNAFTPAFEEAYAKIVATKGDDSAKATTPEERTRMQLVLSDLDQGRATLVQNDLSGLGADDKSFVKHVLTASDLIDKLYATQVGAVALVDHVAAGDTASQSLFRRDWGPKCLEPETEKNPACSAIAGAPKPVSDAYPASLQKDPKFCEKLEKAANSKALLAPFVVVREKAGALEPVPYSVAYKGQMDAIAAELRAAADAMKDPKEDALRTYLKAAAQSFTDNDWNPADEAWAKMNAVNSAWYLRVAPDETYFDPCSQKAGFHVTFARINKDSLAWQDKLVPVEQTMEQMLAAHIGKPYAARKVTFHLPDFIDIVVNAGDDRKESGATIGQSLPNWGPVANEGRGRTVAMSNLFTDPDSRESRQDSSASLFSKETMGSYDPSPQPGLLNTILHEATHNLGPAHEYKFKGKTDSQWFGGQLSSMMEELKAQTGALYYVEFLRQKKMIDDDMAKRVYTDGVAWSFGHISRGMYNEAGGRKPYSQLAAIQLGFLIDDGAITWDPKGPAANGTDVGALTIHFDKFPASVAKLMKVVGGLKASGDKAGAEALAKKYVDSNIVPQKAITERVLRHPKPSLVYGVTL